MQRYLPIVSLLILASLGGCSPYLDDFQYSPHPAVAEIRSTSGQQSPALSAMASIIGVHRDDRRVDIPESIEVRLRLENNGTETVVFDPHTLELTNTQLLAFPAPVVRAPSQITLNAMQGATLTAFFPLPQHLQAGDLDALMLRWVIQIGGQKLSQSVNFRRVYPRVYYDEPYWGPYRGYPPYFWYGGVVVIHRR
jgi:hypothetical protein